MQQRNMKQCQSLLEDQRAATPDLFRAQAAVETNVPRFSRAELKERRCMHECIDVELTGVLDEHGEVVTVEMIRPVHSRDDLAVRLDCDVLSHVIACLQAGSFSMSNCTRQRDALPDDAPRGLLARKDSKGNAYFLKRRKPGRGKRYKRCKTVDKALEVTSSLDTSDDAGSHSDGADAGGDATAAEQFASDGLAT